ncbi:TPA: colonization factor [Vibrio cholerae]|uniref:Core encoded pilin n=7 Tax=root TaxID=1 RepID=A0A0F6WBH0_9VIRU|nr:colonization factor [Vibrio cholerae]YP_010768528.1 core encoded pilin [Vibrio phage pre-CTX]AWD92947.1 core encoded pilin [Vibrio virus CTXphi] [Affertcholeramvirus CTXphi]ABQ18962.1 colonization factor [Vibrio cholerae O395]ABQ19973.1 colonization factor [Vibrio cholerae O395]ACP09579.1 colonization factor [Vibrio cholerae O395]ACP11585.1 colonization factor [Vibrio cholerae O395]
MFSSLKNKLNTFKSTLSLGVFLLFSAFANQALAAADTGLVAEVTKTLGTSKDTVIALGPLIMGVVGAIVLIVTVIGLIRKAK